MNFLRFKIYLDFLEMFGLLAMFRNQKKEMENIQNKNKRKKEQICLEEPMSHMP
jgi:hypothetical protein